MTEPSPIFIDLDRPTNLTDPVRVHDGDLLLFQYPAAQTTMAALDNLQETASALLAHLKANGLIHVTACLLSDSLSVKVLSEDEMRRAGWVRPPNHTPRDPTRPNPGHVGG